jgi:hypothetical protein
MRTALDFKSAQFEVSSSIWYYHVSKIKQYGWLIYAWIIEIEIGSSSSTAIIPHSLKFAQSKQTIRTVYKLCMGIISYSQSANKWNPRFGVL